MGGALHLQDPGEQSGYLLEALASAARDAESGGGIFAFVSADGVRGLLEEESMLALLRRGAFTLVVGTDAVTDERALGELAASAERHDGLTAQALVHDEAVLFHPKLSWFRTADALTLVVGSGNLTVRGLRENWEAFATVVLEGAAAAAAEQQLDGWLAKHAPLLHAPDAAAALARARRNTGRERDLKHPATRRRVVPGGDGSVPPSTRVLVAEAPRSGERPSQVNFDKRHYEDFFGAKSGTDRRVLLRVVASDGQVGSVENRPSSKRDSRNFSLELDAFKHAGWAGGRYAIGVYVRLPQGTFLYQAVAPGARGYDELARFLAVRWRGRSDRRRRVTGSLADVQAAWPDSPIWAAIVPSS